MCAETDVIPSRRFGGDTHDSLCQTLFIALAARLELDLSGTHDQESEEDSD
jgi:hypothetical protein